MFGASMALSTKERATGPHLFGEVVATSVLVAFDLCPGGALAAAPAAAPAVGAYIGAAYLFTSSTSSSPTRGHRWLHLSPTCSPASPPSSAPFVVAQLVGSGRRASPSPWLWYPRRRPERRRRRRPHPAPSNSALRKGSAMSTISPEGTCTRRSPRTPLTPAEGIFPRRALLLPSTLHVWHPEPASTVQTYLPVLVARQAWEQLMVAAQAGRSHRQDGPRDRFVCPQRRLLPDGSSDDRNTFGPPGPQPSVRRFRPHRERSTPWSSTFLAERGISLVTAYPKPLSDNVIRAADVIITMGLRRRVPHLPGQTRYEGLGRRRTRPTSPSKSSAISAMTSRPESPPSLRNPRTDPHRHTRRSPPSEHRNDLPFCSSACATPDDRRCRQYTITSPAALSRSLRPIRTPQTGEPSAVEAMARRGASTSS